MIRCGEVYGMYSTRFNAGFVAVGLRRKIDLDVYVLLVVCVLTSYALVLIWIFVSYQKDFNILFVYIIELWSKFFWICCMIQRYIVFFLYVDIKTTNNGENFVATKVQ